MSYRLQKTHKKLMDIDKIITLLRTYVTNQKLQRIADVLNNRTRYCTIVLEDIAQAHNISATIRSCEALGIQDIHIIENRHNYKVNINITKGASEWTTLLRYNIPNTNNTVPAFDQLRSNGYKIVATTPDTSAYLLHQLPLDTKLALVFGTEQTGLSSYALEHSDMRVTVPMYGFTQSFNISVSAALCLYDIITRLHQTAIDWHLTPQEKLDIELVWLRKIVRGSAELERRVFKIN